MNRKEDTEELVKSLTDYTFTITECAKSLEYYMQLVEDQAFENMILKQRVAELEESYESMCKVDKNHKTEIGGSKMQIDKMIENKREVLHQVINSKGMLDKETLEISEQLDKLILERMSLGY